MEKWVMENVENIMLGVEIVGFIMVGSLFLIYFIVSRKVKQKRLREQSEED